MDPCSITAKNTFVPLITFFGVFEKAGEKKYKRVRNRWCCREYFGHIEQCFSTGGPQTTLHGPPVLTFYTKEM